MALATLLAFVPIFLMLAGTLLSAAFGQSNQTRLVYEQTVALYLAEAAIVDAIGQLEADPSWTAGFNQKTIPGIEGSYTIRFNNTGAGLSPLDSVNNLDGSRPDNYRGGGFLPAGTVSLIASATVGSHKREIEALVRLGGGLYPTDVPVLTTGKIFLAGNVTVDGVKGQADPTAINGSIHSNLSASGIDLIRWDNSNGPIAKITGKVSTVGATPGAINLAGALPGQGTAEGAAVKPVPRLNILAKIGSKSSSPAAGIPPTGTATLASGDRFQNGHTTIQGDLVLQGTNLYVSGNLTVNGAIRGDGSLYVAGETHFQGDSIIAASSPEKVALYSHGSVVLSGFDGTAFMDSLATPGSPFETHWLATKTALQELQAGLSVPNPVLGNSGLLDQIKSELGGTTSVTPALRPGHTMDNPGHLVQLLNLQPNSSGKTGMINKLSQMSLIFEAQVNGSAEELAASVAMGQNKVIRGAVDGVIDQGTIAAVPMLSAFVNSIDYNRLGSSSFQGLVYTNGAFVSQNEVNLRGAVVVDNDGSQPTLTVSNTSYEPGSLNLLDGSHLTYVEDFFKPAQPGGGPLGVKVILWMGR